MNKTKLHQKYVVADLRSDITRHFGIVFMELVDQSARVLQIRRRFHAILYCDTGGFGGFGCIREARIASTSYF